MDDGHRRRLAFGHAHRVSAVVACGITAALMLCFGAAALASGGARVVPAKGKVAGEGYAYYLERTWQILFDTPPPVKGCQTLTVNGQHVGLLTLRTITPMTERYTCSEPAGRPVYAVELSNECSTFKGDHGKFGTTNSQLVTCARALFTRIHDTATVDGHSVPVIKLVATTGVYQVHVPKKNVVGIKQSGPGRSAAHGYGLLLTGLSKGTHVIHVVASHLTSRWDITWTVRVH